MKWRTQYSPRSLTLGHLSRERDEVTLGHDGPELPSLGSAETVRVQV